MLFFGTSLTSDYLIIYDFSITDVIFAAFLIQNYIFVLNMDIFYN